MGKVLTKRSRTVYYQLTVIDSHISTPNYAARRACVLYIRNVRIRIGALLAQLHCYICRQKLLNLNKSKSLAMATTRDASRYGVNISLG
jgi:hypothetical protein